ncbi:hypothetical protein BM451_17115 [Dickeya dadantii]|nr:hypothetical protein BM451_17115 [Dickeya dadantii]
MNGAPLLDGHPRGEGGNSAKIGAIGIIFVDSDVVGLHLGYWRYNSVKIRLFFLKSTNYIDK